MILKKFELSAADFRRTVLAALCLLLAATGLGIAQPAPVPPSIAFGSLYREVEMSGVYEDQKTFADAVPKEAPAAILADYERQKSQPHFDLKAFVAGHFTPPREPARSQAHPRESLRDYIAGMWTLLRRPPDKAEPYSSLLPLGHPYVVPGGRFREIYYWDSYFTMLGLAQDGRHQLARDMLANFASLIDRYGHIPNGNRSYYLSRSQPPFFSCMVDLVAARDGEGIYQTYLPELQAEYDFWMEGADGLAPGGAFRRVLRLSDGSLLNRYWDDRAVPRDESYRQDVETARRSARPAAQVYRDLRAGAESGWDFSSRWLADGSRLATIRTTAFAPVDLNSLMMHLEQVLARAYRHKGDAARSRFYRTRARQRGAVIRRLMWDAKAGLFTDYDWRLGRRSGEFSAATVFPLYFGAASSEQGHGVAVALRREFLRPGGLATTERTSGQQWDRPNGWAPLQYLAIEGLNRYGEQGLAREIARRWLHTVISSYRNSGILVEKYNVEQPASPHTARAGVGGEYPVQAGFGWTNGVLAQLMSQYPRETAAALGR